MLIVAPARAREERYGNRGGRTVGGDGERRREREGRKRRRGGQSAAVKIGGLLCGA